MRILLTADPEVPVPPILYGGIQRIVASLCAGLQSRGHSIGLLAAPESTLSVDAFFPWPGLNSQVRTDTIRNILALHSAYKSFKPDLVHSFSRLVYLLSIMPRAIPKIMSYQRNPGKKPISMAAKIAVNMQFTACARHIADIGASHAGAWSTIYNFVDLDTYTFTESIAEDAPLVFLSRLDPIKGAHTAIAIAKEANRKLILAGNADKDSEYWRNEISPYIDDQQIVYVGPVNDSEKNKLLGSALALVVPIEWDEPFGIVFAEALACGTPVLSCPRGSLPEIVRNGREGFLVESISAAVEAIAKIETLDRSVCRARVEQCFASDIVIDQYEALYVRMLEEQRG